MSQNITSGRSVNLHSVVQLSFLVVSIWLCLFYYAPYEAVGLIALYFFITNFLISGFLHRYCSHRAWNCPLWLEIIFVWLTSASVTSSCIGWAATHIDHHKFTDKEKDPHGHAAGIWKNFTVFSYKPTRGSTPTWLLRRKLYLFQMKYNFGISAWSGLVWSLLLGWQSWVLFTSVVFMWQIGINLIGHSKEFESVNRNHLLSFIWGGELYHEDHHKNPRITRLGKFDFPYLFMIKWYK